MKILNVFVAVALMASAHAGEVNPLTTADLVVIGEYESIKSDRMSPQCPEISHELEVAFKVISPLYGDYKEDEIVTLRCYHYGDNPYLDSSRPQNVPNRWLVFIQSKEDGRREIYSTQIFPTNSHKNAICPFVGEAMFADIGLTATDMDYQYPIIAHFKKTNRGYSNYYQNNLCYSVDAAGAHLSKGIYVDNIIARLRILTTKSKPSGN